MTASNPVISMITGPANYTPREMWRVGGPLSLIYTCVVVLMINLMGRGCALHPQKPKQQQQQQRAFRGMAGGSGCGDAASTSL